METTTLQRPSTGLNYELTPDGVWELGAPDSPNFVTRVELCQRQAREL